jgi:hypothetical protein
MHAGAGQASAYGKSLLQSWGIHGVRKLVRFGRGVLHKTTEDVVAQLVQGDAGVITRVQRIF